jgi:hypothetical protein
MRDFEQLETSLVAALVDGASTVNLGLASGEVDGHADRCDADN